MRALLLLLSACAGAPAPTCAIGTGTTAFEALEPGDEVEIVAGPQGGYHIYSSVRCDGFAPGTLDLEGGARHGATEERLGPRFAFDWPVEPEQEQVEILGLVNLVSDPEVVREAEVLLDLTVSGAEGSASDSRVVVAR